MIGSACMLLAIAPVVVRAQPTPTLPAKPSAASAPATPSASASASPSAAPSATSGAAASPSSGPSAAPTAAARAPATEDFTPTGRRSEPPITSAKPPPLHVDYVQYGAALAAEINLSAGAICPPEPCIVGSGFGLALRAGYRSPGPWYFGGAYEFIKMDSHNLYRLGIFQQARFEMRYLPDIGYRANPYVGWGFGGVAYGNEWGAETGGALVYAGVGVEVEVSRLAVIGASLVYRPVLLVGWTDTSQQERSTGVAHFLGFEFLLEVRTELSRR